MLIMTLPRNGQNWPPVVDNVSAILKTMKFEKTTAAIISFVLFLFIWYPLAGIGFFLLDTFGIDLWGFDILLGMSAGIFCAMWLSHSFYLFLIKNSIK